MSKILLIDDRGDLESIFEEAIEGSKLELKTVSSTKNAKMSLLDGSPALVVSRVAVLGDDRAGLKFCQELRDHNSFSEIPVTLLVEKSEEDMADAAKHFGAKAVLTFPQNCVKK